MAGQTPPPLYPGTGTAQQRYGFRGTNPGAGVGIGGPTRTDPYKKRVTSLRLPRPQIEAEFPANEPRPQPPSTGGGGFVVTKDPEPRPPVVGPGGSGGPGGGGQTPIGDLMGPPNTPIDPRRNIYAGIPGFENWGRSGPGRYGQWLFPRPGRHGNPTRERVEEIARADARLNGRAYGAPRGGRGAGAAIGDDADLNRKLLELLGERIAG